MRRRYSHVFPVASVASLHLHLPTAMVALIKRPGLPLGILRRLRSFVTVILLCGSFQLWTRTGLFLLPFITAVSKICVMPETPKTARIRNIVLNIFVRDTSLWLDPLPNGPVWASV